MLKTVITVSDFGEINGGAAKVAIESAIALADIFEESILFCAVGKDFRDLEEKGVKVKCLEQYDILNNPNRFKSIINGIWNRKARVEFLKLLRTKKSDETIIHVHSWTKALSSSIFSIADKLGFKVVITIHEYFLACPNGGFFNYHKNEICHFKPLSFSCITCNCDNRNYLHKIWRIIRQFVQNREILKRKNISYIYISDLSQNILKNFIKSDSFYRVNNPIEVKDRVQVNVEKNDIFLYIGRLAEEKGIRLFCQVVTELKVNAIVVGDGYLLNELKYKYPNINFVGWQNYKGIRKFILKARCLVFPSLWYETFGLTILEAAAFGVPCIVSDCCAGKAFAPRVLIYKTGSPDSLREKIKLTLDNDFVSDLSSFVYTMYSKLNCNINTYIRELIKVYTEVLNT